MAKLLSNTRVYGTATVDTQLFVKGFNSAHSTSTGALQVSGGIGVAGGGFFSGAVTATNFVGSVSGTASTANNIAGGTAGQLLYQSAPSTTAFVGPGTNGQLLISQGASSPIYVNTTTFAVGLAKNLLGGVADQFAYQTAANQTAFATTASMYVGNAVTATNVRGGTAGQFIYQTAPGVTAFINTGSMYVGRAVVADTVIGGGTTVETVQQTANASYFLTFVDSNNAASTAELIYTTSSFVVNAASGAVGLGTTTPSDRLHLSGTQDAARIRLTNTTAGRSSILGQGSGRFYWQPTNDSDSFEWRNAAGSGIAIFNPSSESLGIGTTGPSTKLHVAGSTGDTRVRVSANDGTNYRGFEITAATTFKGGIFYRTTEGNVMQVWGPNTGSGAIYIDANNMVRVVATTSVHNATSGAFQVSGGIGVAGGGFFGGIVTATTFVGNVIGTVSQAADIAGGTAGQLLYQIAPNDTGFAGPGTAGQLLVSAGASAPVYTNTTTIYVGSSINAQRLFGGTAGQLVYQSAPGTTAFAGPGTVGQVLTSGGTGAPVYVNTSSLYVGRAVLADSATTANSASQVQTVQRTTNAAHFLTFVDSNNASATGELVYTTSSFVVNPSTGNVGIGTASPQKTLHVFGTARVTSLSEFESRVYMGPVAYQRNSANAIQEWGGASASYQLNIQDGTGRINYYWNSNGTTVPTQTVANEDAFKLLLSVDSPALYFYGWEGSSSAAGTAITWSEIFRASMGEANAYFKGSLIPIGSGTANYVTKFTAAGTIGNSQIFDNGTNVGIGTSGPGFKLDVSGTARATSDFRAPIFYDSDNTGFYADPASTSNFSYLYVGGNTGIGSQLRIATSEVYGMTMNHAIANAGQSGGYESIFLLNTNANDGNFAGLGMSTNGGDGQHHRGIIRSYRDTAAAGTSGRLELVVRRNGAYSRGFYVDGNANAYADNQIRAPIFYDSNNTSWFVDPATETVLNLTRIVTGSLAVTDAATRGLVMDGNYTNGQYRHRWRKRDDGNGLPLYLDYSHGTANSFTTIARFGGGGTYREFSLYGTQEIIGGNLLVQTGGTGTYGVVRGFDNWNHMMTMRAIVSGSTASPTFTAAHDMSFVEYVNSDDRGFKFLSSDTGSYVEKASIRQTYSTFSGSIRSPVFYDSNDTSYYLDPNTSGSLLRGRLNITGGHGGSSFRVYLAPGENGAATGLVTLQMWCSEPGNTWDGAGFGYNVDNNANEAGNVPAYYFARTNTSFGQAYMRMTTDGNWYFYNNPSGSNTRYLTLQLERTGYAIAPQSMRSPIFYDSDNTAYYIDAAGGSARIGRDLYVEGYTGGSFGNRLIVGATSTPYTLQDGNIRPTIYARGQYPVLTLDHTVTSNTNHGPTIQFSHNGLGNRQWLIGTSGDGTKFDIGYADSGTGNSDHNPHNGIAGYLGITAFTIRNNGRMGFGWQGDWGALGGGDPQHTFHFVGSHQNSHTYLFRNSTNASNGSGAIFVNSFGNHSWGIVAEFRVEANGGSDRPSILFSSGYNSTTWSVGYGFADDNFRINQNHGHRNGNWGTERLRINTDGNIVIGNGVYAGSFFYNSDATLKENISIISNALNKVLSLIGVAYTWKDSGKAGIGLIAQEVEKVVPEVVDNSVTVNEKHEEHTIKTVNYGHLVGLLVESIKDLKSIIDQQSNRIEELEKKLENQSR